MMDIYNFSSLQDEARKVARSPIELFGSENQKHTFLPGMIRCDLIGAFALTEPDVGSDATNMKTRALLDGEGFLVDGEKRFISTGDVADLVILVCKVYREGDEGQLST